jgi:hypothetical protein
MRINNTAAHISAAARLVQVVDMHRMFERASSFNQPLDHWNVQNAEDKEDMFVDATAFNQPATLAHLGL